MSRLFFTLLLISTFTGAHVFASPHCESNDRKSADICEVVWEKTIANRTATFGGKMEDYQSSFMKQECGGSGSIYRGMKSTTISTFKAIKKEIISMGYEIDLAKLSQVQQLFLESQPGLPALFGNHNRLGKKYDLVNGEYGNLFNKKSSCASADRLVKALEKVVN